MRRPGGTTEASRRRALAVGALVLASGFGAALVAFRIAYSGSSDYRNLVWNLVLAWVPFALALAIYDRHRRGVPARRLAVPALVWLLFLPNAPYLVTDFVHLRDETSMPVWFDVALLASFAWIGLLLGFVSVYLVQGVVRRHAGAATGWAFVIATFGACGIGVYLGRYLRLNTWDLVVRPLGVLGDVGARLDSPQLVGMSLVTAAFLTVAYAMLYSVLQVAVDDRRD
jgi:uncharacterized membrane protein